MSDTVDGITEFVEITPEEIHLVSSPASKFSPVLAKGSAPPMTKKMAKKLAKQLMGGNADPARPPVDLASALVLMKAGADRAAKQGDVERARGLLKEIAVIKLQVAEKAHQARGGVGRMGPGSRQLFARTGTLPEDSSVGGV